MEVLQNWLEGVNPLARHGVTALVAVAGVALWLLGRSLARPLGAVIGLLAGAVAAATVPIDRFGPLLIILGSFLGCVVAWLLFRIWMGTVAAAVAATLVFLGFLLGPDVSAALATGGADSLGNLAEAPSAEQVATDLKAAAQDRWEALRESQGVIAIGAAVAAGLVGLLLGLLAPYGAASVVCALGGTLMVAASLASWARMVGWSWPEAWDDPMHVLAAVGLITAVGVALQWMIFRSRAD